MEREFVEDDRPRYALCKGGEGSGKSVAGVVKTLERLRRGMNGVMVSPDLPHFKKSLWQEFKRWCPWDQVVSEQQYRSRAAWEPRETFTLTFQNGASLICGGIEEPGAWEGPNLSFAFFDEARRHKNADALKVLDGRCRIPGPNGEPPQIWITTTPKMNWLYEYFGPEKPHDEFLPFKRNSNVITLKTQDNEHNLIEGFVALRSNSLTEAEARVLMDADWEDPDTSDRFISSILWWDSCKKDLPALDNLTPMVLAADAAVNGDTFGLIGVTRDPDNSENVAVRLVRSWVPKHGQDIDFTEVEDEIRNIVENYHVVLVTYDAYQLHHMMTRLSAIVWTEEFSQHDQRTEADKQLYDMILAKRISHDGNEELRAHVDNSDRKYAAGEIKFRLEKRSRSKKIDLAVATSMATYQCLELNL